MSSDPSDNPPEAYWERCPRARREHKCYECRGTIKIGTHYTRCSGIWDRRPDSFKLCMRCARTHAYMRTIDREASFGELREVLHEAGLKRWYDNMRRNGGFQYDKGLTDQSQPVVEVCESASV